MYLYCHSLNEEMDDLRMDADHEQMKLKSQIKALKKRIMELEKEVDFLTGYKKGYDALEEGKEVYLYQGAILERIIHMTYSGNTRNKTVGYSWSVTIILINTFI